MVLFRKLLLSGLALMVFGIGYSQKKGFNYDSAWRKVDELAYTKGLPQSAQKPVDVIYVQAKKDRNEAQIIKALLYSLQFAEPSQDENFKSGVDQIRKEISVSNQPSTSILFSILATKFEDYLSDHRYQLYNRTQVAGPRSDDPATWTLQDLQNEIDSLFGASISASDLLQKTPLSQYDPILTKGNTRKLRPTLYDLLANRALEYYVKGEKDVRNASEYFELDAKAFSPADQFIQAKFRTNDSTSSKFRALGLFQKLLALHLNDSDKSALLDVDLVRINFANQWSGDPNKSTLYKNSLEHIISLNENDSAAAQANYMLAAYYFEMPNKREPDIEPEWQTALVKALTICDKVIAKFPDSEGGVNCYNLRQAIIASELKLTTEEVEIPGLPFRTLVGYKNADKISLRIIVLHSTILSRLGKNNWSPEYWKRIASLKAMRQWKQSLPDPKDYRQHTVEIKIDALQPGQYLLLASTGDDFGQETKSSSAQFFSVSNIGYIRQGKDFFVLHRQTGKPLNNATVQVISQVYDEKKREYVDARSKKMLTDKYGHVSYRQPAQAQYSQFEFFWQNDHLLTNSEYAGFFQGYTQTTTGATRANKEDFEEDEGNIYLFTDRSIYRPGQTVYFKGIGITKDFKTRLPKLWNIDDSVYIELVNPNSETVDSVNLVQNEFGSFHGQFKIPINAVTGMYTLETDFGDYELRIQVEEYKRPKFNTELQKPTGTVRLNEKLIVTGKAKAYAGNAITGATVKYTVNRRNRFKEPLYFGRRIMPASPPVEIAHGETTTDSVGQFQIPFSTISDPTADSTLDLTFDFEVTVNVTDINGETRGAILVLPVGYKTLSIDLRNPTTEPVFADSLKRFELYTRNIFGEFQPSFTRMRIYSLLEPTRLIRKRLWNVPDQFVMSETEFLHNFPNDEYKNESKFTDWSNDKLVYADSFATKSDGIYNIKGKPFQQGWYKVQLNTIDSFGKPVEATYYFQVFQSLPQLPAPTYQWNYIDKQSAQPGEKVKAILGSSVDRIYLTRQKLSADPKSTETNFQYYEINTQKKEFEIPIAEKDRGNIELLDFYVKNNRLYSNSWFIEVPWRNKQLSVNLETFRDKIEPGAQEKWKLKIQGSNSDKIFSELMLNMYDASLNQFSTHNWEKVDIWPQIEKTDGNLLASNFDIVNSQDRYFPIYQKAREKVYDEIAPLDRYRRGGIMYKTMAAPKAEMEADKSKADSNEHALQGKVAGLSISGNQNLNEVVVMGYSALTRTESLNSAFNPRKNFNETAFFFPDLKTDVDGSVSFSFTMPEALTQWRLMALAHTKDLSMGYAERMVVTQKKLMVQPNAPRFLRDGDTISFSAKIANISEGEMKGEVQLELFDAATNQPVDQIFANAKPTLPFTVEAGQSVAVQFALNIPKDYTSALSYRIIARAGSYSDGEESALPVLPNRMLVTESLTIPMSGAGMKEFKFEKLLQSGKSSTTLGQHSLTVEYTANPAWYAVQSLPYLMEFPHECAEQMFSRFYANALASAIANSNPVIEKVWENWKNLDSSALLSNLQKNEELKSALLQETPWVMEAKNEAAQKKNIGLLFDLGRMSNEMKSVVAKLKNAQLSNGGFAWFKGGIDDRFITQIILTGIGKLAKLNAIPKKPDDVNDDIDGIQEYALKYADQRIVEEYNGLIQRNSDLKKNNLSYWTIQYLYMRSFFSNVKPAPNAEKAIAYFRSQSIQFWLHENRYLQRMIALSLFRSGETKTANSILASLKENSVFNEELGRYWKENRGGYYWYEAPVETQSLLIEAFSEISKDEKTVNELKTWLLKQKQTNHWNSTKATADACYALLLEGTKWQENAATAEVLLNNKSVLNTSGDNGLGYAKTVVSANDVKPDMGNITVNVSSAKPGSSAGPSWGAVYWQYFEDLDKITPAATPLSLVKKLFVETNTDKGPLLLPVTASSLSRWVIKSKSGSSSVWTAIWNMCT